ncbi:hypothetical protein ACR6C2_35605 [Streptomyces sp. INA 01156]
MAEVASVDPEADPPHLSVTLDEALSWRDEQGITYQELTDSADRTEASETLAHALLRQSGPLASTLGAWLQGMSAPGVFEDRVHLRILALFADDIGVGGHARRATTRSRSSRHSTAAPNWPWRPPNWPPSGRSGTTCSRCPRPCSRSAGAATSSHH